MANKKSNVKKINSTNKKTNGTKKTNTKKNINIKNENKGEVSINKVRNSKKEVQNKQIKDHNKEEITKIDAISKQNDMQKIMTLLFIIIGSFTIFYFITFVLNKKNYDDIFKPSSLGNSEIQYDEILVGTMLKQSQDTYYVLATKEEDKNVITYSSILDKYNSIKYEYKIYTINLDSVFNKKNVADVESFDKDNLKFKWTTLLKIDDKKIIDVYEDADEIERVLNDLLDSASKDE